MVRDYLNNVPLSAVPGHGEVHGMAEGLRVWYGADTKRIGLLGICGGGGYALKADGTLSKISQKWIGSDISQ